MNKPFVVTLLLLLAAPLFAQMDVINEGVALYDQGKYDEAIAKFEAVLAQDPANETAIYELGLTLFAKSDYARCKSVLVPLTNKKGRHQALSLGILGNCLDGSGDRAGAIKAYRRGLKVDDKETQLLYNLAVSLIANNEIPEATKLLKKELTLDPSHASGHFALGSIFHKESFRAAALLEYLRFLSLEPTGDRAKAVAGRALELIGLGVKTEAPGKITINVDPNPRKEEGDFGAWEMMLGMMAAAETTEGKEKLSEFERKRQTLVTVLSILTEGNNRGRSYTHQTNIPFFNALAEAKLTDTYAGIALVSLGLDGTKEWVDAHGDDINAYGAFLQKR